MKQIFTIVFFFILSASFAQTISKQSVNAKPVKLYSPEADVSSVIAQGLVKAKTENKHLLLQIGGNWCPWCIKFHNFCENEFTHKVLPILKKEKVIQKRKFSIF